MATLIVLAILTLFGLAYLVVRRSVTEGKQSNSASQGEQTGHAKKGGQDGSDDSINGAKSPGDKEPTGPDTALKEVEAPVGPDGREAASSSTVSSEGGYPIRTTSAEDLAETIKRGVDAEVGLTDMSVYKRILTRYRNCSDVMLLLCRSVSQTNTTALANLEATLLVCNKIEDPPYYMAAISAQAELLALCCVYYGGGCFPQQEPAARQRLATLSEELKHLPDSSPDIQAKTAEITAQALLTIARRSLGKEASGQLTVLEQAASAGLEAPMARTEAAFVTGVQSLCLCVEKMATDQMSIDRARVLSGKARGLSMTAKDAFAKLDTAVDLMADAFVLFARATAKGT